MQNLSGRNPHIFLHRMVQAYFHSRTCQCFYLHIITLTPARSALSGRPFFVHIYFTNRFALPLRSSLNAFVQKTSYGTLRRSGFKSHFYSEWSAFVAPLIRMNVARTLHFAALFFALGIIVSLLVRGFGTSYWAGWESTWLAESPESVKAFIDYTYGLIPAVGPLPPMLDLAQIVEMRADRLPYLETPVSAAPWLIRMMILMGVVVIFPRLIFACFDTWRMNRFKSQTSLSIESSYFENILVQCAQDAVLGNLLIVTSYVNRPLRDQTTSVLCKHWGTEEDSDVKILTMKKRTFPPFLQVPESQSSLFGLTVLRHQKRKCTERSLNVCVRRMSPRVLQSLLHSLT